jgi:uncharacterized protein
MCMLAETVVRSAFAASIPPSSILRCASRDEFHSRIDVTTGTPLPQPDEEDPFYLDELHMADVGEMLREYVLLELPMQPLCRPDCRGLCPECGADLNVEQCSCGSTSVDERFAALRALLKPE